MFDYTEDTEIIIDGEKHLIRFYDGMTGIGSRDYWVDGIKQARNAVRQTADITKGNHFIYTIKWRDTPWDKVDVVISEEELPNLLNAGQKWREPIKREFKKVTS